MFKSIIVQIPYLISQFVFKYRIKNIPSHRESRIYIFDIDNTLADTWPSLNMSHKNENTRLCSIPVFENIKNLIIKCIKDGDYVCYLSARDWKSYFTTKKWLKKNGLPSSNLFFVRNPMDKVELLSTISHKIYLYDDLSYGHETGVVSFYNQEIDAISKMPHVVHCGYYQLKKLQNTNG